MRNPYPFQKLTYTDMFLPTTIHVNLPIRLLKKSLLELPYVEVVTTNGKQVTLELKGYELNRLGQDFKTILNIYPSANPVIFRDPSLQGLVFLAYLESLRITMKDSY